MKKTLALLLTLLLCLPCALSLAEEAERETFTCGDFEYALLDDGTAEIVRYQGDAETLEIPDELDGHAVSVGDWNPFAYCETLKEIHVSADHPTLAAIDGVLFSKPDKKLVCCPCDYAQSEYTVPQGIKIIGDGAFFFCSGLTSITLPDSVTAIGDVAFAYSSLTSITLPDSVTSIGDQAFSFCFGLTSVTLPDSVSALGMNPFLRCENMTKITVSPDNPAFATIDGVLFSKLDKRLICFPCALPQSEYSVPQGIELIGDLAFYVCSGLTSVTLPDGLTAIGEGAFEACFGLTSVTLPDGLTTIGDDAFADCSGLTSITLPDSLTDIGGWAFIGCENATFTVGRDSYAKQYCIDNGFTYTYPDANDRLNG